MIKYSVQNHFHAAAVYFFHKFSEKLIARLQVAFVRNPLNITLRQTVIYTAGRQ